MSSDNSVVQPTPQVQVVPQVVPQVADTNTANTNNTSATTTPVVTVPPTDLQITNQHVQKMIQAIKDTLNGHQLTALNVVRVAANLMSVAESMDDLPPRLQSVVIMNSLENVIDQQQMDPEDKESLMLMLQGVVNEAINVFQDIKSGSLALSNATKGCCLIL